MEINYIKEFVHLAEVGNFMTAADDLFISQSSLSKHIKSIESELGVQLFNRTTRKVKLTAAGEIFLIHAREIAKHQAEYMIALKTMASLDEATISIGVLPTMAQYDITDIVYTFQRKNPSMRLSLTMGDTYELKEQLRNGTLTLAFLRESEEDDEFMRIFYCSDALVAMVPVIHRLAKEETLPLSALAGEDLCVLANNTMLQDLCRKKCAEEGFDMKIFYQGHHLTNIADFVIKGEAIALITEGQTRFIRNPNVKIIKIVPEIKTDINLCYRHDIPLNSAGRLFVDTTNAFLIKRRRDA